MSAVDTKRVDIHEVVGRIFSYYGDCINKDGFKQVAHLIRDEIRDYETAPEKFPTSQKLAYEYQWKFSMFCKPNTNAWKVIPDFVACWTFEYHTGEY